MNLKAHTALIRRMERDARDDATIQVVVGPLGVSCADGSTLVYANFEHSSGDIVTCSRAHAIALLRAFLNS